MTQHHAEQTECQSRKDKDLSVEQIHSVQSRSGCLLLCRRGAEPLDSGGGSELKNKVKVLLRSQSNFIPPLLVYGRLAYGDTKGRSISITDGVSGISFDMCHKSADRDCRARKSGC